MLASLVPPINHFEVAELRDKALSENGVADITRPRAVRLYAAELLRALLAGDAGIVEALKPISDLCIFEDYPSDLLDFYKLYFAYTDLLEFEVQWHWEGADTANIDSIVLDRAAKFVQSIDVAL